MSLAKGRGYWVFLIALVVLLSAVSVSAETLQPNAAVGKDAYAQAAFANRNQGASTDLEVKSASTGERAFIEFNLTNISSAAIINNAVLTLYAEAVAASGAEEIGIYRITNSWTEGTGAGAQTDDGVTWNSRNGSVNWNTAGGDYDATAFARTNVSTVGYYTWNITGLVRGWVNGTWTNTGLVLVNTASGANRKAFTSSDGSNATNWPKLEVNYTIADTTPPAAVTNLANRSAGTTWIYWNWTNPSDADFNAAIIYINNSNVANTSNNYYNATGLSSNTNYTIRINTKDTTGNVNYTNVTSTARTLSGCTPLLTNTSWSSWGNLTCSGSQMNQSRSLTQYDANNCGGSNTTYYEYQLVGPNYANTSWSSWSNITACQISNYYTQQRNLTQYDTYSCAANNTFFGYQNLTCDYCSYNVANTSWSAWQNQTVCQLNNTLTQNRSKTEYDANYGICYAITGLVSDLWNSGLNNTYNDYQTIACNGTCGDGICHSDETCSSCAIDCGSCPSSGGGGGGGGSSSQKTTAKTLVCEERWSCLAWSNCVNNLQTRTCYEQNSCNTTALKPKESQACNTAVICQENWACLDWGPCENGAQIRICKDVNNCGTLANKPLEAQECEQEETAESGLSLATGKQITGKTVVNSLNLPNPQLLVPTMLLIFALFALFFLRKIELSKHMKELITVLYVGMAAIIVFLLSMTFVPSRLIPAGLFTALSSTKALSITAVIVVLGLSTIAYLGKIFIGHMRHNNKKKVKHKHG